MMKHVLLTTLKSLSINFKTSVATLASDVIFIQCKALGKIGNGSCLNLVF